MRGLSGAAQLERAGRLTVLACVVSTLYACSGFQIQVPTNSSTTSGADSSYGYQPLDPVSTTVQPTDVQGRCVTGRPTRDELLGALPDETMRLAIGKIDASGKVTYGPTSISASNSQYVVTIDYVKSNTVAFFVKKDDPSPTSNGFTVRVVDSYEKADSSVPVYIGIGLRLTANLTTSAAGINLGNLLAIGAAAQANKLSGTLVLQTMGVTGENISTALPVPTEISVASIQGAIQAIGTMKAKLYDSKTLIQPRVVAVYNTLGGGTTTINGFIASVLGQVPRLNVPIATTAETKLLTACPI
ncbi:hypothetical protein [Burkholderia sp. 3C]